MSCSIAVFGMMSVTVWKCNFKSLSASKGLTVGLRLSFVEPVGQGYEVVLTLDHDAVVHVQLVTETSHQLPDVFGPVQLKQKHNIDSNGGLLAL